MPKRPNKGEIFIVNPKIFPYLLSLLSILDKNDQDLKLKKDYSEEFELD